jgi:hypothetical protein
MKTRTLVTTITAFLLLVWAAWLWLLPWGVSEYARSVLAKQGIEMQRLTLGELAWSNSHIKALQLRDVARGVSVQAQAVTMRYHLPALLQGELGSLDVQIQQLSVTQNATVADSSNDSIALHSPLPLLAMMPLSRISIDALRVQQYQQQRLLHDLQGNLTVQAKGVHLQLREQHDTRFHGMEAMFDVASNGDINGDIHHQDQLLATLQGNIKNSQGKLQFQATATMQLAPLSAWLQPRMMNAPLSATGNSTLTIKGDAPAGDYPHISALLPVLNLNAHIQYDGVMTHPQFTSKGALVVKLALQHGQGNWSLTPKGLFSVQQGQWHGRSDDYRFSGSIAVDDARTPQLSLDRKSYIQWQSLRYDTWKLDRLRLQNKQSVALNGKQAWERVGMDVSLPPLQWQGYTVRSGLLEVAAQQRKNERTAQLTLHDFSLSSAELRLPTGDVMVDLTWQENVQAQLRYRFSPKITWQINSQWQPSNNNINIDFDLQLDQPQTRITQLYPNSKPWFDTLHIPAGHIRSTGTARLQGKRWRIQTAITLRQFNGSYGDKTFEDANADVQSSFDGATWRIKQADMNVAMLNIGIPLHNIQLRSTGRYRGNALLRGHIQQFTIHALGGEISAHDVSWDRKDYNKQGINVPLTISSISLAELVALEKQQGLTATGVLDGSLPMRLQAQGVSVQQGLITARQPGGVIRYRGKEEAQAMADQNLGVKMALDILQDFQYHHLSSDVTYHPDGALLLGLHVKGKNPNYDHGRPVELNIQLQENILTLLKSLSLADDIGNQIQRKVSH